MKNKLFIIIICILFIQIYGNSLNFLFNISFIELVDDILLLALLLFGLFRLSLNGTIKKKLLNYPVVVFITVCMISALINAVSFDVFLVQLRSYLLPCILYFSITSNSYSNYYIKKTLRILLILSIPVVISGLIEFFTKQTLVITTDRYGEVMVQEEVFRIFTLIGNPIDYSNFAVIILCIIIPMLVTKYVPLNITRTKLIFYAIIILFTLFLSKSRGPVIALSISLLFSSLRLRMISKRNLLAYSSIGILLILFYGAQFVHRFAQLSPETLAEDRYRFLFLNKAVQVFLDNPFLGVGPGKFGGWVSINYKESWVYQHYNFTTDNISSIDMFFPHLIGELGVLGFVYYLLIYLIPFLFFIKTYRSESSLEVKYISLVIVLLIPCLLLIGWFSISLETQLVLSLYFIILGMAEKTIKNQNIIV